MVPLVEIAKSKENQFNTKILSYYHKCANLIQRKPTKMNKVIIDNIGFNSQTQS